MTLPFRGRAVGDRACIVDLPDLQRVLGLAASLRGLTERGELGGVVDIVPAARTVLVVCADRASVRGVEAAAARLDGAAGMGAGEDAGTGSGSGTRSGSGRTVTIEVAYDGEDLAAVAELTGLSIAGVVAAHTGTPWTAAFGGFAPGFMYLAGGDERLTVPRLDSPRTAVPAGSVAIAGGFSAVYPGESPGGWRLLGRTSARVWDESREPPTLMSPGDTVRFVAVRARVEGPGGPRVGEPDGRSVEGRGRSTGPDALAPALTVVRPGMRSLLQDAGRPGHGAIGVTGSGALDRESLATANALVGNQPGAAAIEVLGGGLVLRAERRVRIAAAGAEVSVTAVRAAGDESAVDLTAAGDLDPGDELRFAAQSNGTITYVAVRGGLAGTSVLGSVSYDSLSGLGTPPLRAGDRLGLVLPASDRPRSRRTITEPRNSHASTTSKGSDSATRAGGAAGGLVTLRFVPGPRDDWFEPGEVARLGRLEWIVSTRSNRVGLRLEAPETETEGALVRSREGELPTEGMVRGSIQVPPSGLPVLFLADHPVTGGYPVIGTVVDADLDLAGRLGPGDRVRFVPRDPDDIGAPVPIAPVPPRFTESVAFSLEIDGRRAAVRVGADTAEAIERALEGEASGAVRAILNRIVGEILRLRADDGNARDPADSAAQRDEIE